MSVKKLYWKMLPLIKHLTPIIPISFRYGGRDYVKTLKMIAETEYTTDEEKYRFQLLETKKLLRYANENVPYWRNLFKKLNFTVEGFSELYHIQKLPILNKRVIRENFQDMISKKATKFNSHIEYTGGTTGQPNKFIVDNNSRAKEWAFMHSQWFRKKYQLKEKKLVFRGHRSNNNKIIENPWYGEFIVSPYDNVSLVEITELIHREKITVIHGYPSRIYEFSKKCLDAGILIDDIRLIFFGSEALLDFQKNAIKRVFRKSELYSWYGQSEQVILGGYCERNEKYHAFYQYGLLEILNDDGSCDFYGSGELIGTGFLNYFMPLIKYRTGDRGSVYKEKCSCGRNLTLFDINEGRVGEFVFDKNGKKIPLTAFVFGTHSDELAKLGNFILKQKIKGEVELQYETAREIDETQIIKEFEKISRYNLKITMKRVEDTPRSKNGKHSYLIQEIKE